MPDLIFKNKILIAFQDVQNCPSLFLWTGNNSKLIKIKCFLSSINQANIMWNVVRFVVVVVVVVKEQISKEKNWERKIIKVQDVGRWNVEM